MIVLASTSPRRAELLAAAGIPFEVVAVAVDETLRLNELPNDHVRRLALEKAQAGARLRPDAVVLGADTVVVLGTTVMSKPRDDDEARDMLRRLSGRMHRVLTGVALVSPERRTVDVATTRVWMSPLSTHEIDDYVASGEPRDKAGAYAIQGLGSRFIERIDGSYANVVGLPVALVYRWLRDYSEEGSVVTVQP